MLGQRHSQPTPTSWGQGCMRVSDVTCHLHFWHNYQGLLCATAVTRERKGHTAHKVKWRRKFSHRSCRDSNSQSFDHESGALTNKLSRLPYGKLAASFMVSNHTRYKIYGHQAWSKYMVRKVHPLQNLWHLRIDSIVHTRYRIYKQYSTLATESTVSKHRQYGTHSLQNL